MKKNHMYFSFAKMPLSEEELIQIPINCQYRPYVYFKIDNNCYGFPCTSKVTDNKNRYNNGTEIFNMSSGEKHSLANLTKIYFIPIANFIGEEYLIPEEIANRIVKKMKANYKYCPYPKEVMRYIKDINPKLEPCDLVKDKDENYYVIKEITENGIIAYEVSSYPQKGLYRYQVDEQYKYINCHPVILDNKTKLVYVNKFYNPSEYFKEENCVKYNYSETLNKLIKGSVFTHDEQRYIVLDNQSDYMVLAHGDIDEVYANFKVMEFYKTASMNIKVETILTEERTDKLYQKYLEKNQKLRLKLKK